MRLPKNRIAAGSSGTDITPTKELVRTRLQRDLHGGGYGGNVKGFAWIKAAAPPRINSFFSRSLSLLMSYVNAYTVTHFAFLAVVLVEGGIMQGI